MKRIALASMLIFSFILGGMLAYAGEQKGLASEDKQFMMEAASGGMMEVQLGKMAQEKAHSPDVKNFGTRMVTDHGRANDELKKIAQQKNVTLPSQLDPKHKAVVDKLSKASGAEFDKAYMREMVKDHTTDVAEFRKASEKVKDPDLKGWVKKTLPVLEQLLQQARTVAQKQGVNVKQAEEEGKKEAAQKEKQKK